MMPVRLLALSVLGILAAGICAAPPRPDAAPPRAEKPAAVDRHGDPLPPGAIARIGTVRLQHGDGVSCLTFSPDGKTLASASSGAVCLWDVTTGKETRRFTGDVPWRRYVVFLPDGKTLASIGAEFLVRFWDVGTGKEVRRLPLERQSICALAISPDGKTVAGGGEDLSLWNLTKKGELRTFNRGGLIACSLAFSPDSKRVAVAWSDGTVRLHEVATGKDTGQCLRKVDPGKGGPLAFSPDGKLLALPQDDNTVRLWEVDTGKERPPLKGHDKPVRAVAFAPDGKTLASSGSDETVRLWDVASGKELRRCKGRPDYFGSVAFTPDGKTLAAVGQGTIQLFDAETGEPRRVSAEPPDGLRRVRFLPDGKTLVSAGGGGISSGDGVSVRLWEAATGKELRSFVPGTGKVFQLTLSPDGEVVALIAFERQDGRQQGWVSLHRVATGKELVRMKVYTSSLAFTPDGRTLLATSEQGVRLIQASTGKEVRQLRCGKTWISTLAVSPDGTMLAAGGEESWRGEGPSFDPTIWLWDLAGGKELRRLRLPRSLFSTLAFSPDGRLLATASWERSGPASFGVVRLWETATGKELRRLEEQGQGLSTVTFSPDGRTLVTGGRGLRLWEVTTGKERRQLRGHDGDITSVDFSPDGRLLASSSQDRTALVWDLTSRAQDGKQAADLPAAELQRQWNALAGDDAAKAYQALRILAATPRQAVPLLRERLRPVPSADPERLARLIRDLDRGRFSVREEAAKELERLGDVALPALRKATQGSPALETRRRLERLIEQAEGWPPETLRTWRALEVLEQIGTPEACEVLRALARGGSGSRLTREASASLERLAKHL